LGVLGRLAEHEEKDAEKEQAGGTEGQLGIGGTGREDRGGATEIFVDEVPAVRDYQNDGNEKECRLPHSELRLVVDSGAEQVAKRCIPDNNYSFRLLLTLVRGAGGTGVADLSGGDGMEGNLAERGGFEPPVQL
jgi:hypothetical protein